MANGKDFKYEADVVMNAMKAKIKELEAKQPKWISVKDRLPLNDETMLICDAKNGLFALVGRDHNEVLTQLDDRPTVVATHWMPLPEAPKK